MLEILKERGYTEKTWKFAFRNGRFSSLQTYFERYNTDEFNINIANEYIIEIQGMQESGKLSYSRAAHLKKIAYWFIELYETGTLKWEMRGQSKIIVSVYFCEILNQYLNIRQKTFSKGSVANTKSEVLIFIDFLQKEKNYQNFSEVKLRDVHDFVLHINQRRNRIEYAIYSVKCFLRFLWEKGIVENDLTPALYQMAQKQKKLLIGFTREEVENILKQPNRETPAGKRDYAILTLRKHTGLRISDIINLKYTDIDWENDKISIIQKKTSVPLTLPLNSETECAIIDYFQNGRPSCDFPFLFIRNNAPYAALSRQYVTKMFGLCRKTAGIVHISGDGKSFHGLRRSIATWMLEANVPLTTISQVLGHRQIDSTNRYLSIDREKLQYCTLSFNGIEMT